MSDLRIRRLPSPLTEWDGDTSLLCLPPSSRLALVKSLLREVRIPSVFVPMLTDVPFGESGGREKLTILLTVSCSTVRFLIPYAPPTYLFLFVSTPRPTN